MKKINIKRLSLRGIFFGILSSLGGPTIIIGICIILGNLSVSEGKIGMMGMICYILMVPIVYGLVGMAIGLSYNWLSPKIGGFSIEIEEELENISQEIREIEIDTEIKEENIKREIDKENIKKRE